MHENEYNMKELILFAVLSSITSLIFTILTVLKPNIALILGSLITYVSTYFHIGAVMYSRKFRKYMLLDLKKSFNYLKVIENKLEKAYLTANSDDIEKYSSERKSQIHAILTVGERILINESFSKKQIAKINTILAETRKINGKG